MQSSDLSRGDVVKMENKLWQVMEITHRTPGNLRAFYQIKFRNLDDGSQKDLRFSANDKHDKVDIFTRDMQFLFSDDRFYTFMDTESYEQVEISAEAIGDDAVFLKPESVWKIAFFEASPISISLPQSMEFEVVEAEPEIKGATATASYKSATLSNGLEILVPQFVKVGDWVKVNTADRSYSERVKK